MDEGCPPNDGRETDEQDGERAGWLVDEIEIPDGIGCVEIWDRLGEARNEE